MVAQITFVFYIHTELGPVAVGNIYDIQSYLLLSHGQNQMYALVNLLHFKKNCFIKKIAKYFFDKSYIYMHIDIKD